MKICIDPGHGGKDPGAIAGRNVAAAVLASMQTAFPDHRSRGVRDANFAVLRLTGMPAILVETEFITSPRQLLFLTDPVNQTEVAAAIATGIDGIFKSTL